MILFHQPVLSSPSSASSWLIIADSLDLTRVRLILFTVRALNHFQLCLCCSSVWLRSFLPPQAPPSYEENRLKLFCRSVPHPSLPLSPPTPLPCSWSKCASEGYVFKIEHATACTVLLFNCHMCVPKEIKLFE